MLQVPTRRPRAEASEAILDAAMHLFAQRPPHSVSVREIAAEAGVNHALVHRYFGSKDALLGAVLQHATRQGADVVDHARDARDAVAAVFRLRSSGEPYTPALARALLDGADPRALQDEFPIMTRLVELVRADRDARTVDAELDARVAVAAVAALLLGWQLFEPFLLAATGMPDVDRDTLDDRLVALASRLVE